MDLITKFSSEGFRYYFMRECPFPADGDFSFTRFAEVYNTDLANTLGNLLSRTITVPSKSLNGVLTGTAGRVPEPVAAGFDPAALVAEFRNRVEAC